MQIIMIFIANWKMYRGLRDSVAELQELEKVEFPAKHVVAVAPSFPLLAHPAFAETKIKLVAQDVFWEQVGQYTGAVSPRLLKELKCEYVIIGHSERRKYFSETDEQINAKVKAVLHSGMRPVVCVGETKAEHETGQTRHVIMRQLANALQGVAEVQAAAVIVAYEPVWAITPGGPAEPEEVLVMARLIKDKMAQIFKSATKKMVVLYGGSVNPGNVAKYGSGDIIDGFLVGKSSVFADTFTALIKQFP